MSTTSAKKNPRIPTAHNFGVLLSQLNAGGTLDDLTHEHLRLNRLMAEAVEHREKVKGRIVLTLDFELTHDEKMSVVAAVKVTEPKFNRPESVFWMTKECELTPHNPKQLVMPLREVGSPDETEAPEEEKQPARGV